MKALLIVAHGSRKAAANEEIRTLTEKIAAIGGGRFDRVRCAFLQLTEPLIPQVIVELVAAGAEEIVVFPFFIAAGSHVHADIPAVVADARDAHPDVAFRIAPHLGGCVGIDRFILDAVVGSFGSIV